MVSFLAFLAAYILSQFYRSFLAVIAPDISHQLGLSPQDLGNMQACWIAGFVLMQFPVGWALDTLGARKSVPATMIFAVAGGALFARAQSPLALDLAMALIGIGCSAIYMGAIYVFGRTTHADRFALLCSGLLGLGSAGNLLAATPLSFLSATIGWRASMMLMAVVTAIAALALAVLIRDAETPHQHRPVNFLRGIGAILSIRALWPLIPITAVSYSVVLAERGLWAGPYFADVYKLNNIERGNAILLMAVAMSVGALAYGLVDRIIRSHKLIVALGSGITAGCFLLLGLPSLSLTSAVLALGVMGASGMTYGVLMAHGRAFFPDQLLGRGITFMNVLFIGGAGILQPISGAYMGLIGTSTPASAYQHLHLAFGLLLLAALILYLPSRQKPASAPTG